MNPKFGNFDADSIGFHCPFLRTREMVVARATLKTPNMIKPGFRSKGRPYGSLQAVSKNLLRTPGRFGLKAAKSMPSREIQKGSQG